MTASCHPLKVTCRVGAFEAAGLRLLESEYPPNLQMRRHGHGPASISFVLNGGFEEMIGSRQFPRQASELIFHAPDKEHSVRFGVESVKILRVEFGPAWADRLNMASRAFLQPGAALPGAIGLGVRLRGEVHNPDPLSPMTIEGLVLELISAGARQATRTGPREAAWLARVRDRLHDEFIDTPSIEELASETGVSPGHLCRAFRERYGATVGAYARRLRIENAARGLNSGETPLARLAVESGFADQSHFTREFRRHFGVTPLEYRNASSG